MLRFEAFRVAFHFRLVPQRIEAVCRFQWPFKRHILNYAYTMYQRPLLLRTFTSIIDSRSDALENGSSRKMKKLLEPSLFDSAVTFEEAFGENVIARSL
jgi:hypothetical protein